MELELTTSDIESDDDNIIVNISDKCEFQTNIDDDEAKALETIWNLGNPYIEKNLNKEYLTKLREHELHIPENDAIYFSVGSVKKDTIKMNYHTTQTDILNYFNGLLTWTDNINQYNPPDLKTFFKNINIYLTSTKINFFVPNNGKYIALMCFGTKKIGYTKTVANFTMFILENLNRKFEIIDMYFSSIQDKNLFSTSIGNFDDLLKSYNISHFYYHADENKNIFKVFQSNLFPFLEKIRDRMINIQSQIRIGHINIKPQTFCIHSNENGCSICQCIRFAIRLFSEEANLTIWNSNLAAPIDALNRLIKNYNDISLNGEYNCGQYKIVISKNDDNHNRQNNNNNYNNNNRNNNKYDYYHRKNYGNDNQINKYKYQQRGYSNFNANDREFQYRSGHRQSTISSTSSSTPSPSHRHRQHQQQQQQYQHQNQYRRRGQQPYFVRHDEY